MYIEERAEFFMALGNYRCEKREKWSEGIDFVASNTVSDEKIFVRLIEPRGKSGFVGADDVKNMAEAMRHKGFDRGALVGKRFTETATREMDTLKIQKVSDDYMPPVESESLLLTINECTDNLCRIRCGSVPYRESDCRSRFKERSCRVRSINDDALFHFERGWMNLMKNDLKQLMLLGKLKT